MSNSTSSAIEHLIKGRPRDIVGFELSRALPYAKRRTAGPFISFGRIGPVEFDSNKGIDVRPQPHIGLATVTYLFEGEIMHPDEERHIWWNFVSSSKKRIEQAKAGWRESRFGMIKGGDEFTPLPE
ncbi:MAG: hypothetical protein CMM26_01935 [Rhodospirillaceae bacterium]|nr:hypothetical protein [Rhodospirillaceae bacterium]